MFPYPNLMAEMARKGIKNKTIYKRLGYSQQRWSRQLRGKSPLSITDAFTIRDEFFPTLLVDYLFDAKPGYDLIDIFKFPDKREYNNSEEKNHDPDDCA